MNRTALKTWGYVILAGLVLTGSVLAQEKPSAAPAQNDEAKAGASEGEASALQKAVQNPVASLISVPIQNNSNFGIGPYDRTQDVLNIQPVIPANITSKWMVISRIIQPIVWQPYPNATTGGEYGLGDMNPTFFLSPRKPEKLIWGAGPAFVIPTATNDILGQGKFSIGSPGAPPLLLAESTLDGCPAPCAVCKGRVCRPSQTSRGLPGSTVSAPKVRGFTPESALKSRLSINQKPMIGNPK
jgi:hypothetical protein